MVPIPNSDDVDMTAAYKLLVDELNTAGPNKYEVITVASVHSRSKSSAFLKLLSLIPDAQQASFSMESNLETIFTTNTLTAEAGAVSSATGIPPMNTS